MKKMQTFLRTLYFSFTDPNYYDDVVKAPFSFSLKYFLGFYLVLSSVFSLYSLYVVKTQISPNIDGVIDEISDLYPNDLIINFDAKNNILSTQGVQEPVSLKMPESEYIEADIEKLLVIDTSANAEDISSYNTAILLTDSHMTTLSDISGGFQMLPYSELSSSLDDADYGREITSITINKSFIDSNLPQIKLLAHKAVKILPIVVLFGLFAFFIISRLIILLILSVFNAFASLIIGKDLVYKKIYQIGLHTITITDAITSLSSLVFENQIPSLFTFSFLGISFITLYGVKRNEKTSKKQS